MPDSTAAGENYAEKLFAFDIGTNSIGWCVFNMQNGEPASIEDIGVRIFSDGRDPKSKASLAVARREARQMRRMRDRYIRRRAKSLSVLTEYGLMPAEKHERSRLLLETADKPKPRDSEALPNAADKTDPYNLRARALTEELPLHHIGRALFHLSQRRGFKSNRKTDNKDNEKGKIAAGVADLEQKLMNYPSLGAYMAERYNNGQVVRLRQGSSAFKADDKGKEGNAYAFYPQRAMLEEEFDNIWDAQARFRPDILTAERREYLKRVIFYQRPLKAQEVGLCAFEYKNEEKRLPKAHPLFQEFRLYKEVNELRVITPDNSKGRPLTRSERDTLITLLCPARELSFKKLSSAIKLKDNESFNKYDEKRGRTHLTGDEIYSPMVSGKKIKGEQREYFGNQWAEFSREKQWEIIQKLLDEPSPEKLDTWLAEHFSNLSDKQRENIANANLPEGYGRLGATAMSKMLEKLKQDVITESKAAELCGYTHNLPDKERKGLEELPKYQEVDEVARSIPPGTGDPNDSYDKRMGRITNPTVHIALNQLWRVVNTLIKKHRKPRYMVVELARDLQLSDKQKDDVNKKIGANTRAAVLRSGKLQEMGIADNGANRLLLKLWEELSDTPENRVCPYCDNNKGISAAMLFSGEVDIDHILPYSLTLDDSQANKVLCCRKCNREKRNRPPAEVLEWKDRYDDILERVKKLPKNKQWRFARDAMQQFEDRGGFLARQLTDTQYICRLARQYLSSLYPGEEEDFDRATGELLGKFGHKYHVRAIPGRLTELLRRNWGLNDILHDRTEQNDTAKPKNRQDHRHHAIDAAVIGVTTGGMLQRIAKASGVMEEQDFEVFVRRAVKDNPPWSNFRRDLQSAVDKIVVSHKQDHGTVSGKNRKQGKDQTAAKLMKETAYGLPTDANGERLKDKNGNFQVVERKLFLGLKAKDLDSIRDENLQRELREFIYTETGSLADGKAFESALLKFRDTHKQYKGIRHVRMLVTRNVIEIKDKNGKAYKGYWNDGNYRYDVWQTLDGKWQSEVTPMFDIHQPGWQSNFRAENPTAKKVLSLQQNDMVAYDSPETGEKIIARVVKFSASGQIFFAPHNEANVDSRNRDAADPFKYFNRAASALKELHCRQIRVDEIGRVYDPGALSR